MLQLASYDRLFPSQDTLPSGGFGNLITLPFQHQARERGATIFVDDQWQPQPDQWAVLANSRVHSIDDVDRTLAHTRAAGPELDATLVTDAESGETTTATPWIRQTPDRHRIDGPKPERLRLTRAQQLYIDKADLPPRWLHRFVRLATFQNPAFYQAQAIRRSVWNTPRLSGTTLEVGFSGTLTEPQQTALDAVATHYTGLLCAATGFGKTVVAAALIARRDWIAERRHRLPDRTD